MLGSFQHILKELAPSIAQFSVLYENNITTIGGTQYAAAFYFNTAEEDVEEVLTCSDGSHKPNTVVVGERMLATTLDILNSVQELDAYLKHLGFLPEERSPYPDWLKAYTFGDDREQQELIRNKELEIEGAKASIECAKRKLAENLEYKSILYTNGAELVGDIGTASGL